LGLLGGALAATVAIRKIERSPTPYDVSVAMAWLKVPLGAFTAILGIVAIHGGFVPGLSVLDSQEQILAYALLLGFAQQAFTSVLDRRAQTLVEEVPSKESKTQNPPPPALVSPDQGRPAGGGDTANASESQGSSGVALREETVGVTAANL
jgi:hypothetical protein